MVELERGLIYVTVRLDVILIGMILPSAFWSARCATNIQIQSEILSAMQSFTQGEKLLRARPSHGQEWPNNSVNTTLALLTPASMASTLLVSISEDLEGNVGRLCLYVSEARAKPFIEVLYNFSFRLSCYIPGTY